MATLYIHPDLIESGFDNLLNGSNPHAGFNTLNGFIRWCDGTAPIEVPTDSSQPSLTNSLVQFNTTTDQIVYQSEVDTDNLPRILIDTDYVLETQAGDVSWIWFSASPTGNSAAMIATVSESGGGGEVIFNDTTVTDDHYYAMRYFRLKLLDNDFSFS